MSWAAHDPEGWDEVCRKAIVAKLGRTSFFNMEFNAESVEGDLAELNGNALWAALVDWAADYIGGCEADYLIGRRGVDV